jgi:hypothetical protein
MAVPPRAATILLEVWEFAGAGGRWQSLDGHRSGTRRAIRPYRDWRFSPTMGVMSQWSMKRGASSASSPTVPHTGGQD